MGDGKDSGNFRHSPLKSTSVKASMGARICETLGTGSIIVGQDDTTKHQG
jgi:hypothetical protein